MHSPRGREQSIFSCAQPKTNVRDDPGGRHGGRRPSELCGAEYVTRVKSIFEGKVAIMGPKRDQKKELGILNRKI